MKLLVAITLVTIALLAGPADVLAQERDGQAPPGGRANRSRAEGLTPTDVEDMLDALALVQSEKALQISEAQYAGFVTRLKTLHQVRKRSRQGRLQMLRELNRLTNPQAAVPDEAAVRERLKALREHDARTASEVQKAYDALDEILDVRQQARFRVFELELERRKLDLLLRARQGAARNRS
jgi:hypothetical protein